MVKNRPPFHSTWIRSCLSEATAFNCLGFRFSQCTFLSRSGGPIILPCPGGSSGAWSLSSGKVGFSSLCRWVDTEKCHLDTPFKTNLLPSYRECGQQTATSCQLLWRRPQRHRAAPHHSATSGHTLSGAAASSD